MAREVAAIATSLSVLEVSQAAIEYAALNHGDTEVHGKERRNLEPRMKRK
jgi:hypothetical protein